MAKEYIIYCDESVENGKYYSDFYGGALIDSIHYDTIKDSLNAKKLELNLFGEVKWSKVSANYLAKYKSLIDLYFEYIKADIIKIRIMFRQSAYQARNLSQEQKDNGFFLLYYQFVKHAFGLMHIPEEECRSERYIRLYFDELPDEKIKCEAFKSQIYGIQSLNGFVRSNLKIRRDDIDSIDSKNHVILQCMDIILGAMAFRLNNKHKEKPEGSRFRGKKTVAKEQLYKHILAHIRDITPNFNIGISTGGGNADKWDQKYRHWKFIPRDHHIDETRFK
jgi:hypothetical protein